MQDSQDHAAEAWQGFTFRSGWLTYTPPPDFPFWVGPGPSYSARVYIVHAEDFAEYEYSSEYESVTCQNLLPDMVIVNGVQCSLSSVPYASDYAGQTVQP